MEKCSICGSDGAVLRERLELDEPICDRCYSDYLEWLGQQQDAAMPEAE